MALGRKRYQSSVGPRGQGGMSLMQAGRLPTASDSSLQCQTSIHRRVGRGERCVGRFGRCHNSHPCWVSIARRGDNDRDGSMKRRDTRTANFSMASRWALCLPLLVVPTMAQAQTALAEEVAPSDEGAPMEIVV